MSFKRFYLACLMGILAGVVCVLLSTSGGQAMDKKIIASIFTSRVLIGFVIGVSALKIGWALHGLLMGLVVSIPMGFNAMLGANAQYGKWEMLAMFIVMGMVYGFFIELITSVVFKAKLK